PGFGGTPPHGHTLTREYLAALGAAALDALGAKRAALVGCSMGGYAAMAFARRFPGRMTKAVLIATKASPDTEEARKNRERQAALALDKGAQAVIAEFAPKLVAPDAAPAVRRRVEELASRATAQGIAAGRRADPRPARALWGTDQGPTIAHHVRQRRVNGDLRHFL